MFHGVSCLTKVLLRKGYAIHVSCLPKGNYTEVEDYIFLKGGNIW